MKNDRMFAPCSYQTNYGFLKLYQRCCVFLYQLFNGRREKKEKLKVFHDASGIFCRVRIKLLLAARGAEIVHLSLVIAGEFCRLFVNRHLADRIDCHRVPPQVLPSFAGGIYLLSSSDSETTVTELAAIAAAASSGENVIPKNGYRTPAPTGINAVL